MEGTAAAVSRPAGDALEVLSCPHRLITKDAHRLSAQDAGGEDDHLWMLLTKVIGISEVGHAHLGGDVVVRRAGCGDDLAQSSGER